MIHIFLCWQGTWSWTRPQSSLGQLFQLLCSSSAAGAGTPAICLARGRAAAWGWGLGLPVEAGLVFCTFAHLQVCLLHSEPTAGEL